jgi:bacterioferritin-associated ferredoxin
MYVCVCNAVSSGQVREALNRGNRSVGALRQHFAFKSCCGRCAKCMREMIEQHQNQQPSQQPSPITAPQDRERLHAGA